MMSDRSVAPSPVNDGVRDDRPDLPARSGRWPASSGRAAGVVMRQVGALPLGMSTAIHGLSRNRSVVPGSEAAIVVPRYANGSRSFAVVVVDEPRHEHGARAVRFTVEGEAGVVDQAVRAGANDRIGRRAVVPEHRLAAVGILRVAGQQRADPSLAAVDRLVEPEPGVARLFAVWQAPEDPRCGSRSTPRAGAAGCASTPPPTARSDAGGTGRRPASVVPETMLTLRPGICACTSAAPSAAAIASAARRASHTPARGCRGSRNP